MITTKIQIPLSKLVLENSKKRAEDLGFSSLNEVVRLLLKSFSEGEITFGVIAKNNDVMSAEVIKEIIESANSGLAKDKDDNIIEAYSAEELIKQLEE